MPPDDPATPGDDVSELDELERLANEYEAAMTNEANEDLTRKQWVEAVVWAGEKLADAVRYSAARLRALTADRDSLRAWLQRAEDAHEIADDALLLIHRAIWPAHRYDWVSGEATGMGAAIVAGVEAAVGERDSLRRAVEALPKTADGVPIVPGMTVFSEKGTAHFVEWVHRRIIKATCECHFKELIIFPELHKMYSTRALAPAAPPGDAGTTNENPRP